MAAQDLTTLAAVREHLQISDAADTDSDALISSLITVASDAVSNYTQRRFLPAETADAKEFVYDGRGVVHVAPFVLRSVTLVRIDTDGDSPSTITSDNYALRPLASVDGVYTRLHILGYGVTENVTAAYPQERVVEVTGNWGYADLASVPEPVERAVILTVAAMVARTASRGLFDSDTLPSNAPAIPGMAKALLEPYRVRVFGS